MLSQNRILPQIDPRLLVEVEEVEWRFALAMEKLLASLALLNYSFRSQIPRLSSRCY